MADGDEELRRAVAEADGQFDQVAFAAVRERILAQLTDQQRAIILADEAAALAAGEFERLTPEAVETLRSFGCDMPAPDAVN